MLVVVEILLLLELLVLDFLFFFLSVDLCFLSVNFKRVKSDEVLGDPTVISPVNSEIMNIVFVPHRLHQLLLLLLVDGF